MYEAYIKQVVRSLDSHSMEFAYVSTVKKLKGVFGSTNQKTLEVPLE